MTHIGLMIEGQDGLNWGRWARLLQAAEDFGYQCLFRSDHFTNNSAPDKDSLELWVSLTYAAMTTRRIEFGSLVAPVTFRQPAMTTRMAAQVDELSGGRLVLGLGAGWNEREHEKFGVPFYDFKTRFQMFTEALEITTQLLQSDQPVTFQGQHFSLKEAQLLPRPTRRLPILIGGNGPTQTLPLVARYADEWNAVFIPLPIYRERTAQLNELLDQQGRQPSSVKRSLMTQVIYAADDAALQAKLAARGSQAQELIERGLIVGTAAAVVDQLGQFAAAGVERFMLQWLDQDDIVGIEHMAAAVLPHFHHT